jgi:hypothetical protein
MIAISAAPGFRVGFAGMSEPFETRLKDGVAWPVGGQAQVDWITAGTETGRRITAAIPPRFADYATLVNAAAEADRPRDLASERRQDRALVDVLRRHSAGRPWWIGYLDTGAGDIVFWDAPEVTLYEGWRYVVVLAGPDQAAAWRPAPDRNPNWKATELPELMFPDDRSWLVSFRWDDDWASIGGPEALIADLLSHPVLAPNARRVDTRHDATPPGDWPG